MHRLPSVKTLAETTRYICLSCRLRQPSRFLSASHGRSYASTSKSRSAESVGTDETTSKDSTGGSVSAPQRAADHSEKRTAGSNADKKAKKPSKAPPKKATKTTTRGGKTARTAKSSTSKDAPKQRKPTSATGQDSSENGGGDEVPEHGGEAGGGEANNKLAASTGKSRKSGKSPSTGGPKTKSKSKRKGSAKSSLEDESQGNSVIEDEVDSRTNPSASSNDQDEASSNVGRVSNRTKQEELSTTANQALIRLPRKLRIRKMKQLGIRKIAGKYTLRVPELGSVRKIESPNDLDPAELQREKHRIAVLSNRKERTARMRVKREGVRRRLREATISAMGVSMKTAMKGVPSEADEDLPLLKAKDMELNVIPVQQPPVPQLAHGLERVLFNPGVYHVRDPRTRTFNFDPHLEKLMPVREFNFDSLNIFTPPSKDESLASIARDSAKKYVASTSSLTGTLKHFHYLLSSWRPINFSMLSKAFPTLLTSFTRLQRAPDAIFLRWKDGVYAVDSDKQYDSANVLSLMGRYMEKLLTIGKDRFMRHKVGSENPITEKERYEPEAYHYSTLGDFVLRSQLDAHDARLPGSGIFDLKTRAVIPIRMDSADYEWGMDYEIRSIAGEWQSFEREYHDMIRSTMLKYSLQVRMGRMDGIFVAFHNIARIFGFQYISLEEMDNAIHGQYDRTLGDQEFLLSLGLLNEVFNKVTQKYPETSLRLHFEARPSSTALPFMYVFAEPVTEDQAESIQKTNKHKIEEWERSMLHGAPSDEGQSAVAKASGEARKSIDEDAVADAAYNVEQDVTSELMSQQTGQRDPAADSAGAVKSQDMARGEQKNIDAAAASNLLDGEPQAEAENEEILDGAAPGVQESEEGTSEARVPVEPPPPPPGPLAAYVLTINNRINGKNVPRPRNVLTDKDKWEVSYSLAPIENPNRAWTLYNMCKQRRYKELSEEKKKARDMDYFKSMLKRITADGRKWREMVDAKEQQEREEGGSAKTLWNERAHTGRAETTDQEPRMKRGLTSWLFGR